MGDILRPDFGAQFRPRGKPLPHVYMGGTAMTCGNHESLPKRHSWGPWQTFTAKATGAVYKERMCRTCALMSGQVWLPRAALNGSKRDG